MYHGRIARPMPSTTARTSATMARIRQNERRLRVDFGWAALDAAALAGSFASRSFISFFPGGSRNCVETPARPPFSASITYRISARGQSPIPEEIYAEARTSDLVITYIFR